MVQAWQLQVDEAVSQAFNAYTSTANALAMKMTLQVRSFLYSVVCYLCMVTDCRPVAALPVG